MEDRSAIVEQFLNYLKYEKRFSEHTAKCYGADLAQFGGFLVNSYEGDLASADGVSMDHDQGGTATAVAIRTEQTVDQRS